MDSTIRYLRSRSAVDGVSSKLMALHRISTSLGYPRVQRVIAMFVIELVSEGEGGQWGRGVDVGKGGHGEAGIRYLVKFKGFWECGKRDAVPSMRRVEGIT